MRLSNHIDVVHRKGMQIFCSLFGCELYFRIIMHSQVAIRGNYTVQSSMPIVDVTYFTKFHEHEIQTSWILAWRGIDDTTSQ